MDKKALLYKFFDKTLTNKERLVFDKLLKNDPEFKTMFEFERDLLQERIDIETESIEIQEGTSSPSFFKYAIVACMIIGLSIFGSKLFIDTTNSEDLFVQNFEVYQNNTVPIVSGSGLKTTQEEAFFKYETKEYKTAIEAFQIEFSKTQKPYYLFYIANSYLAIGDTKQAISFFTKHQTFKDDFYQKSQWYLALAHIKDKNKKESILILASISKSEGYQHKEAKILLKALR